MTGTKKEVRKGLMSLISDCEKGLIDLILTKSISRFCRNTTDCLELVRKLLDLNVCIYFEKENLNTGSMESELMLSVLGSLAENESVSISENEKWSIKKRFQNGTYVISYPPYGYTNVDRQMVIVPEQALQRKKAGSGRQAPSLPLSEMKNIQGMLYSKRPTLTAASTVIRTTENMTGIFAKTIMRLL